MKELSEDNLSRGLPLCMHGNMIIFGTFVSSLVSIIGKETKAKVCIFIICPIIIGILQLVLMLSMYRYDNKINSERVLKNELRKDITASLAAIFKHKEYNTTFLICFVLTCSYVFSGAPIMSFYLPEFVKPFFILNPIMTWKSEAVYYSGIYILGLVLALLASYLIDIFGRKRMLIISSISMTMLWVLFFIFSMFVSDKLIASNPNYMLFLMVTVVCFNAFYCLGYSQIIWVYIIELLPFKAYSMLILIASIISSLEIGLFRWVSPSMGLYSVCKFTKYIGYWSIVFILAGVAGTVVMVKLGPETSTAQMLPAKIIHRNSNLKVSYHQVDS